MDMRFVETVDNKEYEVIVDGTLKYNIKRETYKGQYTIYSDKWVARDLAGEQVGEAHRYRNDLFQTLKMHG